MFRQRSMSCYTCLVLYLHGFNHFRQSSTWQAIKAKYIKLQNIDPEICSILIFQKRAWEQFLYHILCMIFQEKCFSCYALLTDQISLSLLFEILVNMCIAIACEPGSDAINFEINLIFLIKPFYDMTKNSRQKFKYLEHEKSF